MEGAKEKKSKITVYAIRGMLITLIAILLLTSNSKLPASSEDAKIIFTEDTYNFGKVEQGAVLEYSFKFKNEGDIPSGDRKVQPSCGCTGAASNGRSEYNEGESGEIKITFNTQGRAGHQEKHINIMTNDTENPRKDLKFMCDIEVETE
ncbi:MAG: DUF1573 domain-containing protein [Ignavibacteria bacterium]|nr:DUF1573 domain-containing protein [Ignavibacteria bacterium]